MQISQRRTKNAPKCLLFVPGTIKTGTFIEHYHGSSPPNFRGDLKISDQNNWGDLSKKLNLGGAKFKGAPKILGGTYEPQ